MDDSNIERLVSTELLTEIFHNEKNANEWIEHKILIHYLLHNKIVK